MSNRTRHPTADRIGDLCAVMDDPRCGCDGNYGGMKRETVARVVTVEPTITSTVTDCGGSAKLVALVVRGKTGSRVSVGAVPTTSDAVCETVASVKEMVTGGKSVWVTVEVVEEKKM